MLNKSATRLRTRVLSSYSFHWRPSGYSTQRPLLVVRASMERLLYTWPALGLLPPSNYHWFLFSFFFSFLFFFCSLDMHCACPGIARTPFSSKDIPYKKEIKSQQCLSQASGLPPKSSPADRNLLLIETSRGTDVCHSQGTLTYMRHRESATESRNQLSGCPMSSRLSEPNASSPTSKPPTVLSLPLLPASILLCNLEYVPLPLQMWASPGWDSVLSTATSPAPERVGSQ